MRAVRVAFVESFRHPSSVIRHRSAELDFTCLKISTAKIIKKIAKCKEIAIYFFIYGEKTDF